MRRGSGVRAVLLALSLTAAMAQPPVGAVVAGATPPPGAEEAGSDAPVPAATQVSEPPSHADGDSYEEVNSHGRFSGEDCELGAWSEWSTCTASCGGGSWHHTRSVIKEATGAGSCKEALFEANECNGDSCPVDCVLGDWGDYSACSVTCGKGVQTRTKPIVVQGAYKGKSCPSDYDRYDSVECNVAGKCPAHCEVGDWGHWTDCEVSCLTKDMEAKHGDSPYAGHNHLKSRTRKILTQPGEHGASCPATFGQKACTLIYKCPIDCLVGDWGTWSECSKTCGKGERVRARPIIQELENLGHECLPRDESEKCKVSDCPLKDCFIGAWGEWGECSRSCGLGLTTRVRTVSEAEEYSKPCPHIEQTEDCANHHNPGHKSMRIAACPSDCEQSEWTAWSECSTSCGGGDQRRFRDTTKEPAFGGAKCGSRTQERRCNNHNCPVDCPVGAWDDWSVCSATCGAGEHIRHRATTGKSMYGGAACTTILHGIMTCNLGVCPTDDTCVVSAFGDWSQCSHSCNSGSKTNDRVIITEAEAGKSCERLKLKMTQRVECNSWECPEACEVGDWGDWDVDHEALTGKNLHLIRRRGITKPGHNGGMACPPLVEHSGKHIVCDSNEIFGDWSGCTKDCGVGYKYRYYERFHCSDTATVKVRARVRQGQHCNTQRCDTPELNKKFNPIQIPRLHTSIRNGGLFVADGTEDSITWPPTTNPTAAPTPEPHHCDGATHLCWTTDEAKATCVKSAGSEYTCQCPAGFAAKRQHLTHAISKDWSHLTHLCEAIIPTDAPTNMPTSMPTFPPHHCDVNTHYCWKGAAASAKCVKTAGAGYDCECPAGTQQTKMHLRHSISEDWEHLRHMCEDTSAPTQAPTDISEAPAFVCSSDQSVCDAPCAHGKHCCSDSINMLGLCGTCMSHACGAAVAP